MRQAIREWLPLEIATRPDILDPLDVVVQAWSKRWFSRASFRLSHASASRAIATVLGPEPTWRVFGAAVAIGCTGRASRRVAGLLADVDTGQFASNETDEQILAAVEARLFSDLAAALERRLNIPGSAGETPRRVADPFDRRGGLVATLATGGADGPEVNVAIPLDCLVPLCRSVLGAPSSSSQPLADVKEAVGAEVVRLRVTLGAAAVTLGALRALAPGDIVILDTSIGASATVTMSFEDHVVAAGTLLHDQSGVSMMLQDQDADAAAWR